MCIVDGGQKALLGQDEASWLRSDDIRVDLDCFGDLCLPFWYRILLVAGALLSLVMGSGSNKRQSE